jgi:hypothetical protein
MIPSATTNAAMKAYVGVSHTPCAVAIAPPSVATGAGAGPVSLALNR